MKKLAFKSLKVSYLGVLDVDDLDRASYETYQIACHYRMC